MSKSTKKSKKTETPNTTPATAEVTTPTKKMGSHGDKKILSIAIDPQLHSSSRCLPAAEGRSVTDLVVEAVSRNLKGRIAAALEALKADLEKVGHLIRIRYTTTSERDTTEVWLDGSVIAVRAEPYVHLDEGQGGITRGDIKPDDVVTLDRVRARRRSLCRERGFRGHT